MPPRPWQADNKEKQRALKKEVKRAHKEAMQIASKAA